MNRGLNRRDFLATSAALGVGTLAVGRAAAAPFKTKLQKAMIGKPTEEYLKQLKDAGFDGIESSVRDATAEDAAAARKTAEKLGMKIHSVLRGWMNFNSPNPADVEAGVADVARTLQTAQAYGATAVLVVPCRIDAHVASGAAAGLSGKAKKGAKPAGVLMPQPWEFDIEFDEKTGHVSRVVKGDNKPYADYIAAQNLATDMTKAAVRKLIPVAEKCQVAVALENVWNSLWVKPALAKNLAASFDSPWIKFYFDIGNHVKFAPPEEWIRTLGNLIVKCHVKDFKLEPDGHGGKFIHPRDGSVNWPAVRQALDAVGYNGFLTVEDGGLPLEEFNKRLDLIIAGK